MDFEIYHPVFGELNSECTPNTHEYEYIGDVEANSLEGAFKNAQNDFNPDYGFLDVRSTSVGDIIKDEDNRYYIVEGIGFKEVDSDWVKFINWEQFSL